MQPKGIKIKKNSKLQKYYTPVGITECSPPGIAIRRKGDVVDGGGGVAEEKIDHK